MARLDLGALWHALAGLAIGALAVWVGVPGWLAIGLLLLGGWLREVLQHDLRLTLRQWLEALAWGGGAALAWGLVEALA